VKLKPNEKIIIVHTKEDEDFIVTETHPVYGVRAFNPLTGGARWFELQELERDDEHPHIHFPRD
jgi:intein/homing endonuclease